MGLVAVTNNYHLTLKENPVSVTTTCHLRNHSC